MPKWWNWQTRWTQNPVVAIPCGFDSRLRHHTNYIIDDSSREQKSRLFLYNRLLNNIGGIILTEIFKALSEESRLRVLSLLLESEMCVCEIEVCLKLTQSNVSRHLSILKKSGILESYKQAQWTYYKIDDNFKKDHEGLWLYLQKRLKDLPSYIEDQAEIISYREGQNNCK